MSDETDKVDEQSPEEDVSGPVGGERLAEARRELKVPVLEIAKELHLDEYKVRALESNDFDVIGAPVFAKGHLRKYAQLVHVSEADVMADYYRLTRSNSATPVLAARRRPQRVISPGPWLLGIVIIAAAAAAYWWFVEREAAPARPATGAIAPLPQSGDVGLYDEITDEGEKGEVDADSVDADGVAAPVAESPVAEPEAEIEVEQAPVTTPAVPELRMSITYSGDCWTEITDATGQRLFFALGKAGRTVELSGEPPFNVLFGDAENVSVVVNDVPYTIATADRRGRTARLTINGS